MGKSLFCAEAEERAEDAELHADEADNVAASANTGTAEAERNQNAEVTAQTWNNQAKAFALEIKKDSLAGHTGVDEVLG